MLCVFLFVCLGGGSGAGRTGGFRVVQDAGELLEVGWPEQVGDIPHRGRREQPEPFWLDLQHLRGYNETLTAGGGACTACRGVGGLAACCPCTSNVETWSLVSLRYTVVSSCADWNSAS